ncbi:restriction endonuclease subunit S [Aliarcobacter butzleri]|uniref:restriction endonuclease subunit S n=1 Tax=Aliarcobacter butzleri TaxID=28197 RepID=UPI002B24A8DC|nr:restriction endonuclease subunit S [Aliarcobacter butzleri]
MSYSLWEKIKFGDMYEISSRNGLTRPSAVRGKGFKMVNMGELFANDRIDDIPMERVLLNDKERVNYKLENNDLLFARQSIIAEGAGKCSIVIKAPELTCFESHIIRVRLKEKMVPMFYYYLFQSDVGKAALFSIRQQGVQAGIRGSDLEKLILPSPKEIIKKKIAKILSNYDDLIENNLKQIKLLEEKARVTYEEWFLRYRINGKKLDINIDTGFPIGWDKKPITSFQSFKQDKSKVKEFVGEKRYLATADVDKIFIVSDGEKITWENKPSRAQIAPSKNSVWFARMSDTYKVLCFTGEDEVLRGNIVLSSGFAGFKAKNELCLPFLYCTINSNLFHELKDLYATGATQVSLNNESMKFIKMIEPDINTIENFGKVVLPMIKSISTLVKQNELLKESRDILLPRLMTGMINVENLDIEV